MSQQPGAAGEGSKQVAPGPPASPGERRMAALRVLRRRWGLASDDMPFVALLPTALYTALVIMLVVAWGVLGDPSECYRREGYAVFFGGLLGTGAACAALGCWLIREGLRGSISEEHKRWLVPYLLLAVFAVILAQVAFTGYGLWVVEKPLPACFATEPVWVSRGLSRAIVWVSVGAVAALCLLVLMFFNLFPNHTDRRSWEKRCRCVMVCCCCKCRPSTQSDDARQPTYMRLAELFHTLFGTTDWVASDVLASLLLAGQWQRCQRLGALRGLLSGDAELEDELAALPLTGDPNGRPSGGRGLSLQEAESETSLSRLLTPSGMAAELKPELKPGEAASLTVGREQAASGADLAEAAHFCKFAFASYGYALYVLSKPHTNSLALFCGRKCRCLMGPLRRYATAFATGQYLPSLNVSNYANTEAILQITGLPEADLVSARFGGDLEQKGETLPYFIALDRRPGRGGRAGTGTIVISVRGTLSYDDLIVDGLCEPVELDDWLPPVDDPPHMFDTRVPRNTDAPPAAGTEGAPGGAAGNPLGVEEASTSSRAPASATLRRRDSAGPGTVQSPRGGSPEGDRGRNGKLRRWAEERPSPTDHPPPVAMEAPGLSTTSKALPEASRASLRTAHAGMTLAAKGVCADIKRVGALAALREGRPVPGHPGPLPDCRGWDIVVTGHSLGGGVAVLIALYLRATYPNTKCWAFEPPGGLANARLANECAACVTSVVLGKDWVPRVSGRGPSLTLSLSRLTLATFERLRDDMKDAARRCKLSKAAVLVGALRGRQWAAEELFDTAGAGLEGPAYRPPPSEAPAFGRSDSSTTRYELAKGLRPPGRLLFLRPVKRAARLRRSQRAYEGVYIQAEDLLGEGILVSTRMMGDHMPDYLLAMLRETARQCGAKPPEGACGSAVLGVDVDGRGGQGGPSSRAAVTEDAD